MTRKYLGNITDDETMKVNFAEYTSGKCGGAKVILSKIGVILLVIALLGLGSFLFLSLIKLPVAMVPLAIFCGFVIWLLWGFTSIEYDYTVYKGKLTLAKLYGGRVLKVIKSITLSEAKSFECLGSVGDAPKNALLCVSGKTSNVLIAITDKDGSIAVIEAPDKTVGALKYYNSRAFSEGKGANT